MNNIELVDYAKKCLELGENSIYIYGAWGNKLTASFCDNKYNQYPTVNTKSRTEKYKKLCDGKHYAFDCVGLIKSFYWGGYGKAKYNSKTDVSANGMYNKAKVKGNISTMDKSRKGLLVQKDGHIGIYIGNDEVIECTIDSKAKQSHGLGGVTKTKLSERKWEHWLECPYIDYVKETKPAKTSFFGSKGYFSYGDNHENIGRIAEFMYKTFPAYTKKAALGNYYGKNIQASIKEFQKRAKADKKYNDAIDGCCGPKTLKALEYYGFKH